MAITNKFKRKQLRETERRQNISCKVMLNQINTLLQKEKVPLDELPWVSKKLDCYFKLLNKVLPDMKTVEVTGEINSKVEFGGLPETSRFLQKIRKPKVIDNES